MKTANQSPDTERPKRIDPHWMVSIHDLAGLRRLAREHRIEPDLIRKLRGRFCRKSLAEEECLSNFSPAIQSAFASNIRFHSLLRVSRHDSISDGATKVQFQTGAGDRIESVILRVASGRTTLCLSTQSGCAAACAFCATGRMGLQSNLSADEILDQVVQCRQLVNPEQRPIRNLVFMGMGEPFHNESSLYPALGVLCSPEGFAYDQRRILVSTVGIPNAMIRFARQFPRAGLALSLHSARQNVREQIIPLARKFSLSQLRRALEQVAAIQDRPVMIEYLLLKNLNDGEEDLQALKQFLSGIPAHVNLIPFNPLPWRSSLEPTPLNTQRRFARDLKNSGFQVTIRYSLGSDVAAACGQLAGSKDPQE
jgi:23S rRNA (adenine2503-C2)-methyltransferase